MERRDMVGGDDMAWEVLRRAYEGDELTVAEICAKFGVTAGQLKYRRLAEGWKARPVGRGKKVVENVEQLSSGSPSPGSDRASSTRTAISKETGSGDRKARSGKVTADGMATDRGHLVRRLFRAIETELTIIEERMADTENRSPQDSERDTRSIGALIKNLEKLTEFDEQQGGGDKTGAVGQITADDADRIRRDLAKRIERIIASEEP